jgi:dihydrofolate reductase
VPVDGYFVDRNGDMTWAKNDNDEEFNAFSAENAKNGGLLLFGSVVDEYQIVVNPIALGEGRTMFDNIKEKFSLKLTKSRIFRDGRVFLCYQPAK